MKSLAVAWLTSGFAVLVLAYALFFNYATGKRCGAHTEKLLLQTYKRDTGEIMHDLSVPIFVQGKHWGGFRVGYRPA